MQGIVRVRVSEQVGSSDLRASLCTETCRPLIADRDEQKECCEALSWGNHILPDLESGKVLWSLARINQVSKFFQCPPDYFLMGDEVAEEKTGMLRML